MLSTAHSNLLMAIISGVKRSVPLDLTVVPTAITATRVNGAVYTSQLLDTSVAGGVAPFTYQWTSDGDNVDINSPTDEDTTLTVVPDSVTGAFAVAIASANPHHWWKLDDNVTGSGNTLDSGSAAANLTCSAITQLASSLADGTGNSREVGSGTRSVKGLGTGEGKLDDTQDFTIEFAFYNATTVTTHHIIVGKEFDWEMAYFGPSSLYWFRLQEDGGSLRTNSWPFSSVSNDTWHWISIRMDYTGTAILSIKMDGANIRDDVDVSSWSGLWQNSKPMGIGRFDSNSFTWPEGRAHHVTFHKRALTDAERALNFKTWNEGGGDNQTISENITCEVTDSAASTAQVIVPFLLTYGATPVAIITPSGISVAVSNGSFTSSVVTASLTDGVGPFTYQWTRTDGLAMTADSPTSAATTFSGNEIDKNTFDTWEVAITDTGNNNLVFTAIIIITIAWGNVPIIIGEPEP